MVLYFKNLNEALNRVKKCYFCSKNFIKNFGIKRGSEYIVKNYEDVSYKMNLFQNKFEYDLPSEEDDPYPCFPNLELSCKNKFTVDNIEYPEYFCEYFLILDRVGRRINSISLSRESFVVKDSENIFKLDFDYYNNFYVKVKELANNGKQIKLESSLFNQMEISKDKILFLLKSVLVLS